MCSTLFVLMPLWFKMLTHCDFVAFWEEAQTNTPACGQSSIFGWASLSPHGSVISAGFCFSSSVCYQDLCRSWSTASHCYLPFVSAIWLIRTIPSLLNPFAIHCCNTICLACKSPPRVCLPSQLYLCGPWFLEALCCYTNLCSIISFDILPLCTQ